MPTYVYRREDGSTFEIKQRITEEPLEVCPDTGQAVKRVISANTGLIFKGSGFYLTDYARNGKKSAASPSNGNSNDSGGDAKAAKDATTASKESSPAKTSTTDAG